MKATIRFKDPYTLACTKRTIEVEKDEPNFIVREFVYKTKFSKSTYITTIKCGIRTYEWFDTAHSAF